MNSFYNYVKRFTRNRFYKFVLFFIIFCIISMCKGCKVYAYTNMNYNKSQSYITYHFGTFNVFYDGLYTDYVNEYTLHFNNSDFVVLNTGTYGQYLRDIQIHYVYNTIVNITSSKRYISFNFRNFLSNTNTDTNNQNYFKPFLSVSNALSPFLYTNFYNFVPFSVEYFDTDLQEWKGAKVYFYSYRNNSDIGNYSQYILDIPVGTNFNEIVFRFGTLKNLVTSEAELSAHIYGSDLFNENNEVWFYPYSHYLSGVPYNSLNTNNYRYLSFLSSNTPQINNLNYIPTTNEYNGDDFALNTYNSSLPDSSRFRWSLDFSDVDYSVYEEQINNENQSILDSIISDLEQDNVISDGVGLFDDSLGDFVSGDTGSAFTGLFSSMFIYPLNKLDNIKDEGLWGVNDGGNEYLNLGLCTGHTLDGHFGNRLKVYVNKDYYFNVPCPHYDIYPYLKSGSFGFYSTAETPNNFYIIYKTIIDGILVYLLFINILNIYKYALDVNDTKIEVLEL